MMDNIFVWTDPAGNIKPDKENSRRRLMVRLQQSWHLTGQFGMETVREVCIMIEHFLFP